MIATRMGATPAVAAHIARLGGEVQGRFDDVGYLYVRLPIERLSEVSELPDVLMANLDGALGGSSDTALTDTLLGVSATPPAESNRPMVMAIDNLLSTAATDDLLVEVRSDGRFSMGGQDLYALMANRAVEVHGKPIFASAGDGARVDSIDTFASARRVLAVGSLDTDRESILAAASSRGPAADGGAKPDFVGVSMSEAASMAAALAEAARTENLPSDARHILWALRMSARRLDGYQPHEQGFGIIDTTRALELLRQVKSRKFDLPDILTRAPVKTYLSRFLPEPGVGQGLYEREGWLVKRPEKRKITLTRQNGPSTPLTYTLQWQANDGTFSAKQDEVILPFDTPVEVEIYIAPEEVGIHSALLYLVDKMTQLAVHTVMTTIVASEQFTAANGYTIQHRKQTLAGRRAQSHFIEVPPNVSSLRMNVTATVGQVEMLLGTGGPSGAGFNSPRGKAGLVTVTYPPPGVYELTLLPVSANAQVEIDASIYYVDSQLDEAPPKNNATKLWMNNIYAPLQKTAVLTEVGARRVLEDNGGPTGMRAYNITVPADSTTLRVAASPGEGRARLGLYLYDCVTGSCILWGSDVFTKTTEKILIAPNPRAGLWRVVVDAGLVGTPFKYSELITNPSFGSGQADGQNESRKTGARWNQSVSFEAQAAVPFGYDAVAVMDVIDAHSDAQPLRPLPLTTQVFKLSRSN